MKKHITKKSSNSKLKGKCYINEKTNLATEKEFVLHHSMKKKIEKLISFLPVY